MDSIDANGGELRFWEAAAAISSRCHVAWHVVDAHMYAQFLLLTINNHILVPEVPRRDALCVESLYH